MDPASLITAAQDNPTGVLVLILIVANIAQWRAAQARRREMDKLIRQLFRLERQGADVDDDVTEVMRRHDPMRD